MPDRQLENYSHWLNERPTDKSVIAFRDWVKDEVKFQVEVVEKENTVEPKTFEHIIPPRASMKVPGSWQGRKFSYCCNREWNKKHVVSLFSLSES